jgi:cytochrome c oxidase subunit II
MLSGALAAPPTAATFDSLVNWYLFFGVGASIVVVTMLAFFMVRYRYRGEKGPVPHHKVEGWKIVAITALISLTMLTTVEYQTFASFSNIEIPSASTCMADTGYPCVQIRVLAFQWGWNFTYPSGEFQLNNLTVPAGRDVVLNITSKDVFHSFGLEMLAEKEDAVPGRTNQMWFMVPTPNVSAPSEVPVQCNSGGTSCVYVDAIRCFELCGVGHALMIANFTVVSQATWNAWPGSQ